MGDEFVDFLLARRSVRRFTDAPVTQEHLELATRAGQRASTSSWIQGMTLIHVADPALKAQLCEVGGVGQQQNIESGALLVICADCRRHELIAKQAGVDFSPNLETFLLGVIDASLFLERFCAALEALGYGCCYCGGMRNFLPAVDSLLALPTSVFPLFGIAVGVPDGSPTSSWKPDDKDLRPRLPVDAVLMKDGYISDEQVWKLMREQDIIAGTYYEERADRVGGDGVPPVGLVRSVAELQSVVETTGATAAAGLAEEGALEPTRNWSGLDAAMEERAEASWKSMLTKFNVPVRTHLLSLFTMKGANFDSSTQATVNAVGGHSHVRIVPLAASSNSAELERWLAVLPQSADAAGLLTELRCGRSGDALVVTMAAATEADLAAFLSSSGFAAWAQAAGAESAVGAGYGFALGANHAMPRGKI